MSIADKLATIAANEQKVYDAGKQAEHDAFWDAFQKQGNLTYYRQVFNGAGWNTNTFYPQYDIKGYVGHSTFFNFNFEMEPFDLAHRLEECGVVYDSSTSTVLSSTFYSAYVSRIPAVSCISATMALTSMFAYSKVVTIDKLILKDDGSNTFNGIFTQCVKLENLTIEGTIGQNGFHVSDCTKLTHDSLMSIIGALKDYSADTSGTSWVVTLGETNLAKLSDEEKAIATGKGWTLA